MSNVFLNEPQLTALEKAVERARTTPGTHRELIPDGEVIAYQFRDDILWTVNRGERNVARGVCPRAPQAD